MSGVFHTIDRGGGVHTRRAVRGVGGQYFEDARHWIGLLQYNPYEFNQLNPVLKVTSYTLEEMISRPLDVFITFLEAD